MTSTGTQSCLSVLVPDPSLVHMVCAVKALISLWDIWDGFPHLQQEHINIYGNTWEIQYFARHQMGIPHVHSIYSFWSGSEVVVFDTVRVLKC